MLVAMCDRPKKAHAALDPWMLGIIFMGINGEGAGKYLLNSN